MRKLLIFCALLLFVAPVQAQDHRAVDSVKKLFGLIPPPPPPPLPGMSRERQQDVIEDYYRNTEREREREEYQRHDDDDHGSYSHKKGKKKKKMPRGLRKKAARGKDLPPGWRKKVARGEVLDRDMRDHCQELPTELSRELPRPPKGTKFLQLEDKIIRVVESTFEIVDVFTAGR